MSTERNAILTKMEMRWTSGDETVYLNGKGVTLLIVYGE